MDKISRISYQIVLVIILAFECKIAYATIADFASSPRAEDKWWCLLLLFFWTAISCFFWHFGDTFFRNSYNPVEFKSAAKQFHYWKEQLNMNLWLALFLPFFAFLIWPRQNQTFGIFFFIAAEIRCVLIWWRARRELEKLESASSD